MLHMMTYCNFDKSPLSQKKGVMLVLDLLFEIQLYLLELFFLNHDFQYKIVFKKFGNNCSTSGNAFVLISVRKTLKSFYKSK